MLVRRDTKNGANDLHTVYRPCAISEVVGNDLIKNLLRTHISKDTLPHSILFSGPAGCGKTTMARILALSLNCENFDKETLTPCLACNSCKTIQNQSNIDYLEVNVGSSSGKDAINDIVRDLSSSPFTSKYKILVFDECHQLTEGAKNLLLKVMEDCYSHVFIIFCTNHPEKLAGKAKGGNPFLERCNHFVLDIVDDNTLYGVLENIVQFEGVEHNTDVLRYIAEYSKGVPRNALVSLNSIITEGSWDLKIAKQLLGSIILDEEEPEIIELSRALIKGSFTTSVPLFADVAKKYSVEAVRIAVTGYFVACLKGNKSVSNGKKISQCLDYLTTPIYLTGKPAEHIFYNIIFKVASTMQGK